MVLGELVKTKRKSMKMSQAVFAKKLGTSQATVSKIETVGKIPSAVILLKIAHTLKIPTSKIFRIIKN